MKILKAQEMGEVDRLTTSVYRIPSILLMENAGRGVADEMRMRIPGLAGKKVMIFCGKGNNGGDGFVVARYLHLRGGKPEVLLFADPSELRGDAKTNFEIIQALGLLIHKFATPATASGFLRNSGAPDVIVDALFGTGLSKPLGGGFSRIVGWINRAAEKCRIVSVDIPSGLFADSPSLPGPAVKAHLTVSFTAPKLAQLIPPAADLTGELVLLPIGSPEALLLNPSYLMEWINAQAARNGIHSRARDSHKGSFGHVFIVAGSRGKSGAALMAGLSALRTGAGLATLWLPESLQKDIVGRVPEVMTESLPETRQGTIAWEAVGVILPRLKDADALVIGPGLTNATQTAEMVRDLVRQSSVPVILDADGINAFAGNANEMRNQNGLPLTITPHPGEMARLSGTTIKAIQADRIETARRWSALHGCHTVLKGYQTITASPGGRILINSSGNAGMATGGSGDVLAGIAGCFAGLWNLARNGQEEFASSLACAVYLHGLAGDLAAGKKGMESLIATDLIEHLPSAIQAVSQGTVPVANYPGPNEN
jgi:ADP-dependent NAD(P)H-hydrate dehydratase / NAD(P)H-hydrate epimerase